MSEGFAYHRIVLDSKGRPCDFIFHEINEAFERLVGLKAPDVIGRKVTQVLPGIENDPADWIGKYGQVALTGKPQHFESYSPLLDKWFLISAFSPHKGHFAVTFNDISERKRTEDILNTPDIRTKLVKSYGIQAYFCHPLIIQDRLIGTLSFGTKTRPRFESEEIDLMRTVANNVALAMQRIQVQKTLQDVNRALEQQVLKRTEQLANNYESLSRANAKLKVRADQLRRMTSELTMAEQRERNRLSKVLHDGLQQNLATAKMLTCYFADKLRDKNRKHEAYAIEAILDESMQMSRSLSVELSPPVLQEAGLARGLEWLARWMREKHNFNVELAINAQPDLPEDVTVLLFESVRELLFNAIKHAKTSWANVSIDSDGNGGAQIVISDEGVGFDPVRLNATESAGGGLGAFQHPRTDRLDRWQVRGAQHARQRQPFHPDRAQRPSRPRRTDLNHPRPQRLTALRRSDNAASAMASLAATKQREHVPVKFLKCSLPPLATQTQRPRAECISEFGWRVLVAQPG